MGDLPPRERPRERLLGRGAQALSDIELVAILLGSGNAAAGVIQIAEAVVALLQEQGERVAVESLERIPGVGVAGACRIAAALELARRLFGARGPAIRGPADVAALSDGVRALRQEHFVVLTADGAGHLLRRQTVFVGTLDRSLVHPREVFAEAIADRAASIFLVHNHPSGSEQPSDDDIAVTRRLAEVGRVMGIEVRDHVIVTRGGYYSFREHGLL